MKPNKLLFLLLLAPTLLLGQASAPPAAFKIDVFPPAPNASSLGKFVDVPVGLYNGVPEVSVPIWTVKEGSITLPVSLNYHAGGIQVAEIASWCGLGWALQAGGVITRSVRGLADDDDNGFLNPTYRLPTPAEIASPTPSAETLTRCLHYATGYYDSQPDLFVFNFGGRSGKFQMDQDGNRFIAPLQRIKIEPVKNSSAKILKWVATTEDGFTYIFDKVEKTRSSMSCTPADQSSPKSPEYITSWYLTLITAPSGESVSLEYDDVSAYSYPVADNESIYEYLGGGSATMPSSVACTMYADVTAGVRLRRIKFGGGELEFVASTADRYDLAGDKALDYILLKDYTLKVLRKFQLTYQYMVGNGLSNTPATGTKTTSARLTLMSVQETDAIGTSAKGKYSFSYKTGLPDRLSKAVDHWGFFNSWTSNASLVPSQMFNGVLYPGAEREANLYAANGSLIGMTYPTGGSVSFEMENNATNNGLPVTVAKEAYVAPPNNNPTSSTLTEERRDMFTIRSYDGLPVEVTMSRNDLNPCITTGCACKVVAVVNKLVNGVASGPDLISSNENCAAGVTSDITKQLPVGDYVLTLKSIASPLAYPYTYNGPFGVTVKWKETTGKYVAGGLRIKQMIHWTDNKRTKTTSYVYTNEAGNSTGRIAKTPSYGYYYRYEIQYPYGQILHYFVRTSTPNTPLGRTQNGYVGYGEVTVYRDTYGATTKGDFGKSVYKFTTPETFAWRGGNSSIGQGFPYGPGDNFEWTAGVQTEAIHYRNTGANTFAKVQHTVDEYEFHDNYYNTNTNIRNCLGLKVGLTYRAVYSYNSRYAAEYYNFSTGYKERKKTLDTLFDDDPTKYIAKQTVYTNSLDHLQTIRSETNTSDGKKLGTYTSYPTDYADASGFIADLKTKNILDKPIETVAYKSNADGSNLRILSGQLTTYKTGGTALPDAVYAMESVNPVPLANFRFSNRGSANVLPTAGSATAFYCDPSLYKKKASYDHYDAKGNILQYSLEDHVTSVHWGYNGGYPVLKAQNMANGNNVNTSSHGAYNGFETGALPGALGGWSTLSSGNSVVAATTEAANVYAGKYALKIHPMVGTSGMLGAHITLAPTRVTKYKMTARVKTPSGYVSGKSRLYMSANSYTPPHNVLSTISSELWLPPTYGTWRHFELTLDLATLTTYGPNLRLICYAENNSTVVPIYVDEVRISPVDAMLTSYTYDPLVGVTSEMAPNGSTTFYEYDTLGRLKLVRDEEGNITKSYSYKYQGQ